MQEEFEDTKGVIRICKSKKDRQHNDQKIKYKRTNNDLQNIHIKLNQIKQRSTKYTYKTKSNHTKKKQKQKQKQKNNNKKLQLSVNENSNILYIYNHVY